MPLCAQSRRLRPSAPYRNTMKRTASPSRPSSSRRLRVPGAAAAFGLALAALARAQAPADPTLVIVGTRSQRFAVPDCVPRAGDAAAAEACKTITQVLRNDLKFEDVPLVPE